MKKMVFSQDMYYRTKDPNSLTTPLYLKGQKYDVKDNMVARWIKRGGVVVDEMNAVNDAAKAKADADARAAALLAAQNAIKEAQSDLDKVESQDALVGTQKKTQDILKPASQPSKKASDGNKK